MHSNNFISVIVPTFNPNQERLAQTLRGLQSQTFPAENWELILVDNNSSNSFISKHDFSNFCNFALLQEGRQGLTFARLAGFAAAKGNLVILVDDDNILAEDYLENVSAIFSKEPLLGAIGGKSIPLFETSPEPWVKEFYGSLALRDLGDEVLTAKWGNNYPACAPIGAGMAIRKEALTNYIAKVEKGQSTITDRTGNSLSSGGDNDIVLEVLKSGWMVGYYPELSLQHIIPHGRTTAEYLGRLVGDSSESWVKLLEMHRINPWKKISKSSVIPRKIKAWFQYRAWESEENFIKWKGACGLFRGLSEL